MIMPKPTLLRKWFVITMMLVVGWPAALLPAATAGGQQPAKTTGIVERKIQAGSPAAFGPRERESLRADRAVAILVDGLRMWITTETTVKNRDGSLSDFNRLPIPCQAEIVYLSLPDGNRMVMELSVRQILPNATTEWSPTQPN